MKKHKRLYNKYCIGYLVIFAISFMMLFFITTKVEVFAENETSMDVIEEKIENDVSDNSEMDSGGEEPAPTSDDNIQEDTTQEPDTQEPDTQEPDTQEPDTQEPDTQESDTQEPDTQEPDTQEATTQEATTEEVMTEESSTEESSTEESSTEESSTEESSTEESSTEESSTEESSTEETTRGVIVAGIEGSIEGERPERPERLERPERPERTLASNSNAEPSVGGPGLEVSTPSNATLATASNALLMMTLDTLSPTTPQNATYGDFELVLPTNTYVVDDNTLIDDINSSTSDLGDGVASDMNAVLYVKLNNTNMAESLNYWVTIYDETGSITTQEVMTFSFAWSMTEIPWEADVKYPVHALYLTGLSPGSRVIVEDIAISGMLEDEYGTQYSWDSTSAGVYLSNILDDEGNDLSDVVTVYEGASNPVILSEHEMGIIRYLKTETDLTGLYYQTPSNNTFSKETNLYTSGFSGYPYLDKLLNNINVFSFNDIEATHIVGPILAGDSAYYKRETPVSSAKSNTKLIFADYSRGIPSYVENITMRADGGRDLAANYDYDVDYDSNFDKPIFYTSTSTKLINNGGSNWLQEYVVIEDEAPFLSPNNSGETPVHHQDDYIDFTLSDIYEECVSLLTDGSIENYAMTTKTFNSSTDGSILYVNPGECWTITNADQLTQIDIVLPDGAEYFSSSSPDPLTINFTCDTINPTTMDGKTVSQFPLITMNGKEFDGEGSGETIEYNEFGNKLIFNMPYIKTDSDGNNRVVTYSTSQNIPGHLLMPKAEFWNYYETTYGTLAWEGGNINGLLLAKDVHVGEIEMHMWAYGGRQAQYASYSLRGVKTVNEKIPNESFMFELNLATDQIMDGIYTDSFPLIAESDVNGDFHFQYLVFYQAGTYNFIISEIIPTGTSDIVYDQSEYRLTIEVEADDNISDDVTYTATGTITQIKDSSGNDISDELIDDTTLTKVSFNNTDTSPVFPNTGGGGTTMMYLVGCCMMMLTCFYYKRLSRKERGIK